MSNRPNELKEIHRARLLGARLFSIWGKGVVFLLVGVVLLYAVPIGVGVLYEGARAVTRIGEPSKYRECRPYNHYFDRCYNTELGAREFVRNGN